MNTMQFLMAILNWLQADPSHLVVAASAIAAVIPTPNPATPWGKAYRVLDALALNVMHAKETGVNVTSVAEEVATLLAAKQATAVPAVVGAPIPATPQH
ncbi:hypothetical protein [Paraburkholderia sp. HD33-4]|uniref:hypothetical protein n=1 Tax=Paraburkholderia sp. HD33-4 TaxID=2883242 RepID=UPI001F350A5F|nr:hypothetical protein [Paraburkholderia sp. HD33-4]